MSLFNKEAYIYGLTSSFPPHCYTQEQMLSAFLKNNPGDEKHVDFCQRVFRGSQIESCYSSLPEEKLFKRMDREEYMTHVKSTLHDMGMEAARGALAEWGGDVSEITHIIWGSMTGGMFAPSMDITLAVDLGLPLTIKRLNVENMGCLTGYRCLGLASSIAKEHPSHRILLIVGDVRNALGNCFTRDYEDKSNVIVASLFRDSCAACVVSGRIPGKPYLYKVHHHESLIVKDTYHLVKYSEKNDDAVHLFISKELPCKVVEAIPTLIENLLKSFPDVTPPDCNFCLHTGGPRIINGIKSSLEGLTDDHFTASWEVMKKYGNLSGSSNLVVLDFNRRAEYSRWNICLSVGPGICLESLLVERPPEGEFVDQEVMRGSLFRTSMVSSVDINDDDGEFPETRLSFF